MKGIVALALAMSLAAPVAAQDVVMRRPLDTAGSSAPALPQAADAASVRSVGTAITTAAMQFLKAHGYLPGSTSDLVPAYLPSVPSSAFASIQGWAFYSVGSRGLFQMSVPSEQDCDAINRDANNGFGYSVIPGGDERSVNEGCYYNGSYGFIYVDWYNN